MLVAHFIKEFNERHGKEVTRVSFAMRKRMESYDWPGNVRELRNTIESMVVQDQDGILDLDDLQEGDSLRRFTLADGQVANPDNLVGRPLTDVERFYVERALEKTKDNREEAALLLGISERTLYRKIQEWNKERNAQEKDEG